jgi:hypothetical protein
MPANKHECPGSADVLVGTRAESAEFPRAWQSPHPAIDRGRLQSIAINSNRVLPTCGAVRTLPRRTERPHCSHGAPSPWEKVQRKSLCEAHSLSPSFHGELEAPPILRRRPHPATNWERGVSAPRQSLSATAAKLPRRKLQNSIKKLTPKN